jgi:colanic acid biosynthesis glycosyl transferase WcaI
MAMNRQPRAATPSLDGPPPARPDAIDPDARQSGRAAGVPAAPALKILILALNSAPEPVGAGKVTGEMAAWLADRGHSVEVVAAPPYYPRWRLADGDRRYSYRREGGRSYTTLRCPIYVPRRPTGARRLLHHLSFAASSLPVLLGRALRGRPDIVLCVAPSMLAAPNAWLAARLGGAAAWLHVQDLELDAAVELGFLGPGHARGWAAALEARLLRRFDRVTTVGPGMADRLAAKGVAPMRLGVLANWVDCRTIRPVSRPRAARAAFGLPDDAFLALYSGSLGDKQGLQVLVEAAERLVHRRDLHIAVFGEGPAKDRLRAAAAELPNLTVGPLAPAARLNDLLNCADVHLLPQAGGVEKLVLPSKLTHMLASGRPVVAAAPADSHLAALVGDCGLRLDANDGATFARAIDRLASDPVLCRSLARSARERAVERLDRETVLARLERALYAVRARRQPAIEP